MNLMRRAPRRDYCRLLEQILDAPGIVRGGGMKLPKVISREDCQKVLAVPNLKTKTGLRNYVILFTLYRAGLRVEEVCSLAPEDVMLDEGWISVQQGKGGKDRVVPISEDLKGELWKWKNARPEGSYFFSTYRGKKMDQSYIRRMVYSCSEKAGVYLLDGKKKKSISPHTLRHCFATELLEEGFSIVDVQALLGHSSTVTTSVYLHVRPMALAEKMRKRVV